MLMTVVTCVEGLYTLVEKEVDTRQLVPYEGAMTFPSDGYSSYCTYWLDGEDLVAVDPNNGLGVYADRLIGDQLLGVLLEAL